MNAKWFSLVVVGFTLALWLVAIGSANGIGIQVSALNASASAISLPVDGNPSSGDLSISLTPGVALTGTLDQATGRGTLVWPARLDAPFLHAIGSPPIDVVFVGPFFTIPEKDLLVALDVAYFDVPPVGAGLVWNLNQDFKEINRLIGGGPGTSVSGVFGDSNDPVVLQEKRTQIGGMMAEALTNLLQLYPALDKASPILWKGNELNPSNPVVMEVLNLYSNDPNTELVISFANAEGLQTSQLTGTDTLDLVPEPATVMLLIFGLIGALTISRRSNK